MVYDTILYLEDFLATLQMFQDNCGSVRATVEDFLLDDPCKEIFEIRPPKQIGGILAEDRGVRSRSSSARHTAP